MTDPGTVTLIELGHLLAGCGEDKPGGDVEAQVEILLSTEVLTPKPQSKGQK